jgi:hypothetical protein
MKSNPELTGIAPTHYWHALEDGRIQCDGLPTLLQATGEDSVECVLCAPVRTIRSF